MRILPVLALFALGCGASAPSPQSAADAEPALDWALLLPIETDGLGRVDLARVRRSPHRASVQPVFDDLLIGMAQPAMREALGELLARTDVILVGLMPPELGIEDEALILARGSYRPDEVARMRRAASSVDVDGHRVWVGEEDGSAFAQLRGDTVAFARSSRHPTWSARRSASPSRTVAWRRRRETSWP